MEAKLIYQVYRGCMFRATSIFRYYEKYSECLAIDSLEKEMYDVFSKISLTYANFITLVSKRIELNNPNDLILSVVGYAQNYKTVSQKSKILQRIADFMDVNEHQIMRVISAALGKRCIDQDIESLESSLNRANRQMNRMENLLISSQQIYHQRQLLQA